MEGIKSVLEKFYLENRENNLIMSKDDIISLINSKFSTSDIYLRSKEINLLISIEDIMWGFKNIIIVTEYEFLIIKTGFGGGWLSFDWKDFLKINGNPTNWGGDGKILIGNFNTDLFFLKKEMFNLFDKLKVSISEHLKHLEEQKRIELEKLEKEKKIKEELRVKDLKASQNSVRQDFDKDGNNEVDILDGSDFNILLKKNQTKIIEIDRNYIQKFVKVSSYIKTKKGNIQLIFNSIKDTSNQKELNEYIGILKNEIHNYNLVLFSSLSMITTLVNEDMITFYEIHESFDKLNMFNSNWENEVSQKLTHIGDGINNLMYAIQEMGNNIVNELGNLSYLTEELNESMATQLREIESSINANNLLTGIQTYQLYKINNNTKGLN